ncbi:PHD finger protein 14-like isoform X1 [Gigantopelta aegis]|uniref:PHD finger protein 14-like isoform X1 n=1 Tax=Gigantopelta aegis TaxID=1735272 RepID=UPI001B887F31|nr:PHD finger protein 14-like isoform X1 [Gigantopelta aegis]XP_041371791.1 PHD finger protein 14-like isoform X2 [Gigantopelta aegis]XP_041371792.1 PHD finger protein 14-like isoform X1 [Gigantopelta aegis]XP_041371793.1 PHD finger protein 14-like isoform X1 [Gigantopelta aegis]
MTDDITIEGVDPSVSFLYKTMLSRDPKKRKVKPVQKHLIQLDFGGLDDSDEDSDFDIQQCKGSGSSDDDNGDKDDVVNSSVGDGSSAKDEAENVDSVDDESTSCTSDDDNNSDDAESSQEEPSFNFFGDYDEDEDEDYVPKKERQKKESKENKPKVMSPKHAITAPDTDTTTQLAHHDNIRVLICCVCLTDTSVDDDEIVECDNCGVSVHEGCYGITESQSAASTESSASTEPWFCDACKSGVTPHCELCPNFGGIYKETDAGKWVHLVCALYTPGVAFGDVDRLSPVTLFEMPYSRWGAKECALCEDLRFARTGVCIGCDAGMCRTFFHVSCAQREGFLSEASHEEAMDIADPFYAYCKLHAEKNAAKAKRRNWLAIQSHIKTHSEKSIEDEKENARFLRKLNRHKQKYEIAKSKRPPTWIPKQKFVRFLTSSPSVVRRMLQKAELMGIITQVQNTGQEKQEPRKKSHAPTVAFSQEFIGYYLDRNVRIQNMKQARKDLLSQNEKLQQQEKILRSQYDQLFSDVDRLKDSSQKLQKEGEKMWSYLVDVGGKGVTYPDMFKPRVCRSPNKRQVPVSPPGIIHQCGICKKTTDQHLLAHCDNCKQFYHLGCLNPPLSRMPKKTKLMGWQCSQCVRSSSDEDIDEANVDVDAPRRLREKNSLREPYRNDMSDQYETVKRVKRNQRGKLKARKPKPKSSAPKLELSKSASVKQKQTTASPKDKQMTISPKLGKEKVGQKYISPKTAKEKLPEQQDLITSPVTRQKPVSKICKSSPVRSSVTCVVCGEPGRRNTVKCDECQLHYHFKCLKPPSKKTPKQPGYSWHCEACDPTDNSDEGGVEMDVDESSRSTPIEGTAETILLLDSDDDYSDAFNY